MHRIATLVAAVAAVLGLCASAQGAVQVSTSGWAWGDPTPQGNTIRAMDFAGGRGYAVGDDGTALRTDDGGATWTGLATGTTANLARVQAVDANTVVVLGGDGCSLRRSADGGATFRRIYTPTEAGCPDRVQAVRFVTPDVGYLFLRDGSVLRTADGGQTFSKQTALPGTPASPGGGSATPVDATFSTPDAGLVFVAANGAAAYATTDQGVSWKPVDLPAVADPRAVTALDATTLLLVAAGDVVTSGDGGATWHRRPVPEAGSPLTGIDCVSATTCLLTTERGDVVLRTTDGLKTVTRVTASTQAIYAAAFASAARVVGAGAGGATVVSDDGGANFTAIGGELGGSYTRLRVGATATSAYAVGRRGSLARTVDAGATWTALSVPTSVDLADVAFASDLVGYALDTGGGLFKTANAGQSWQTLDPGTNGARAVGSLGAGTVLLVAPTGLRRQIGGGRFDPVADRDVAHVAFRDIDVNSGSVLVWGPTALAVSTDRGARWRAVPRPNPGHKKRNALRVANADFTDATHGFVLDVAGRLWRTTDGGRAWARLDGVGSSDGIRVAFGSASDGFLVLRRFGQDAAHAYVLRTTDAGRTWRPQLVSAGDMSAGAIAPATGTRAYALVAAHGPASPSRLFATSTGGDAGKASTLTLATTRRAWTKKALRAAHGRVVVTGTLAGAQGGEQIVVSALDAASGRWRHQVVSAGANGGSFTTTWTVGRSSLFVAQWAGDSGRTGLGSRVLGVSVR
jgi:photosystem II stability/assembly factor-like uncharacterized protein